VLADRRPTHPQMSRDRVDGAVGLGEEIKHPATRRMADRPEDARLAIGSYHRAGDISKGKLTRQVGIGPLPSWTRGAVEDARRTHREEDVSVHWSVADALRSHKYRQCL
jgi:hypothetical protein